MLSRKTGINKSIAVHKMECKSKSVSFSRKDAKSQRGINEMLCYLASSRELNFLFLFEVF